MQRDYQDEIAELHAVFGVQKEAFTSAPYPSADERQHNLGKLKNQLRRYQDALAEAIDSDFSGRAHSETLMLDILPTTLEINHCLLHLKRWMRRGRRPTELLFATNSLHVTYQPKGVVGIIGTWNFPIYLSLGPLVTALAAGNRAMILMPRNMPATTAALRHLLAEIFPEHLVAVIGGVLKDPNIFTSLPFDHIVFTGSPAIGKVVMRQAAQNLTPVTLELGGKSPAVVLRDYSIADAAKRIAHGKGVNCGQICVSPDYAMVPRESVAAFIEAVKKSAIRLWGDRPEDNTEYTSVVNEHHAGRIRSLLDDARKKGAAIVSCGGEGSASRIPLHVVTGCTSEMALMQEEIFGPILPIIPYDSEEEVVSYIQSQPRPLALYCFSHNADARQRLLRRTHSGGVTINDWGWHVLNHAAPFGGVGNSGMGNYHGEEGFRELSHARTVFKRHRFFPIDLFYPPYGNMVQRLALRLFIGKSDPNAKLTGATSEGRIQP